MKHLTALCADFEAYFAHPDAPEGRFTHAQVSHYDRSSAFPQAIIDEMQAWQVSHWYVPAKLGGKLASFDELYMLIRLLARRDLSATIGHAKTFLGAVSVWCAGSELQQTNMAELVKSGEAISLALTERQHGSDISASDFNASKVNDQEYLLNGEKYLINNATRSHSLCVFSRTAYQHNARDFSLFLVDKAKLSKDTWYNLPKARTHGIKGADISGIQFNNAKVDATKLIGPLGTGLETVLKGFQLSRTLCGTLVVGAADTAVRKTLSFCRTRLSGNKTLLQLPLIRSVLNQACIELLIRDCTTLAAHRAINVLPGQMSLISAHVKATVPAALEYSIEQLADVLGARGYLEGMELAANDNDSERYGNFGKLIRDMRLVSVFDGNTVVNQQAVLLQLNGLARKRGRYTQGAYEQLSDIFNLAKPNPEVDLQLLSLSPHGKDDITNSLLFLQQNWQDSPLAKLSCAEPLKQQLDLLCARLNFIDETLQQQPIEVNAIASEHLALADAYAQLFNAACCLQLFIHSAHFMHPSFQDGQWLLSCLRYLNKQPLTDTQLVEQCDDLARDNCLLSPFAWPLASLTPTQKEQSNG
jgi:alkylation response protein AidB-like acyl-CoA dehydrogenase